jgi:hypothetical protein
VADVLNDDEQATLNRLNTRLNRDVRGFGGPRGRRRIGFNSLDAYYDGEQRLEQLGIAVPEDLRQFVTIVAWPGTQVDSIVERCRVDGFRLPGKPEADSGMWEIWQANDLDTESPLARVDSKVFGRGYYCIGSNEDIPELPLITVESPMEMTHEWSNRKRATTSAARFYDDDAGPKTERKATLYLPNSTTWLVRGKNGWEIEDRDDHELGRTPVVPLPNRQRTHARYGSSQMGRIITLTDAAARALTNAQVATEVMALPQRFAAGMTAADFKDPVTQETLTAWEAYFGSVWASANKDAKFGQFQAADLGNFTKIVSHYAQLVSGVTGLPMRYLGQLSDNPPSADGIRADEARLVQTCEASNTTEGGVLEQVMRISKHIATGDDDPSLALMETLFRNPATPTIAQAADASVKLFQAKIISKRQARLDMGYTTAQITNMEQDDELEQTDPVLQRIVDGLTSGSGSVA